MIIDALHAMLRLGDGFLEMFLDFGAVNSKKKATEYVIRKYKLNKPFSFPMKLNSTGSALEKFLENFDNEIEGLNFTNLDFVSEFKKAAKNTLSMFRLWTSPVFYTRPQMLECCSRFDDYVRFWKKLKAMCLEV